MPIYEYHCTDCDTDFEQFLRSMASQEIITCPECGGQHVKKAISLFGGMSGGSSRAARRRRLAPPPAEASGVERAVSPQDDRDPEGFRQPLGSLL